MYTQTFITSAVAVLLAAQAHAAPIRARQAVPPTSILPVGMANNIPLVAPIVTPITTNTNTSDFANGSSGGGGTAGSGGSSSSSSSGGATPAPASRKGSKAAKRQESTADILAPVNDMVTAALATGTVVDHPGQSVGAGQGMTQGGGVAGPVGDMDSTTEDDGDMGSTTENDDEEDDDLFF